MANSQIFKDITRGESVDGFFIDFYDDDVQQVPADMTGYTVKIDHRQGSSSGRLLVSLIGTIDPNDSKRVYFSGFNAEFPQGRVYYDLLLESPGKKVTIITPGFYKITKNVTDR